MKNILVIIAITATLAASAQVPSYVPTNGLVGYWPFNGNANDESGNGNDGINSGATLTTDRFSNPNSAYIFDGVNDKIEMDYVFDFPERTISGWFNLSQFSATIQAIIVNDYAALANGHIIFQILNDSIALQNGTVGCSQMLPTLNTWYFVASTRDATSTKYFINGIEQCQAVNGVLASAGATGQILRVGADRYGTQHWFNGMIDDVGIWNRALTQCEIKDLYNAQLNSVDVSAGNDLTVCEGDEIVLSGSGADSYSWNNGVLDSVPFIATNTSEYVVVGTDTSGCVGVDTIQVNVLSTSSSSQNETSLDSYVWSVNGQTYTQSGTYTDTLLNVLGCDSIVTLNLDLNFTGIPSENDNEFNVFPNPVNELLTIINSSNASKNIKLIDKQGRLVLESIISKETNTINLAHLESGNYLLFIEGNDSPIQIIKK